MRLRAAFVPVALAGVMAALGVAEIAGGAPKGKPPKTTTTATTTTTTPTTPTSTTTTPTSTTTTPTTTTTTPTTTTITPTTTTTTPTTTTTTPTTTTTTPTAPTVSEELVTPEGARILVYSDVSGWTAQQIYDLLKPNAYQLDRIGPSLTVKVQTTQTSAAATTSIKTDGVYSSFKSTLMVQAKPGAIFATRPDYLLAHEYGHIWSRYHLFLTQQGDWSSYLQARGLSGDTRVDSTYNWSKSEMIADDYRILFGSPSAVAQAAYINSSVPDPRNVAGLREFLVGSWAAR